MSLKLDVVEHTGSHIRGLEVEEITLPGADGQIGLLPAHIQMISVVGIGPMKLVLKDGSVLLYAVAGGFVEVLENNVRILTEACESKIDIDTDRARRALSRATIKLEKLTPVQEQEYKAVLASQKRAQTRIDVAAGKFN